MSFRSPLGRARGLGAAREGVVSHWWLQRLTAVALIPLALWFVYGMARYHVADYQTVVAWMHNPYAAIAMILWLVMLFYHSALGLEIVMGDYIGIESIKVTLVILQKFVHVVLAVACVFAVLKLAFGAA
ncbi:MAG: succinate dehydrogenase, hydrophobic membrane anchor protein [Gammaproteobacteria bacterium]|nr:succinate dehydrogenase, hydrophobic membrane anchor protein [Gammaproteobacteria bacterium]